MTTALSGTVGLRRIPRQARSRARVDAIIAALVELVTEAERPGDLTTADVADRAGLPLGSLYEYFEDLESIVDAAVARMLERHDELVASVTAHTLHNLDELTDVLLDTYLRLYREQPAFVSLRHSVLFQPHHRDWLIERVRVFVRNLAAAAVNAGILRDDAELADRLDLVFTLGDAVITATYRDNPKGEQRIVEEGRTILRYAVRRAAREAGSEAE